MMDKLIAAMDAYFKTRPGYYEDVVSPPSRAGMRVIDLDFYPQEFIRAILTALREPSPEMIQEAARHWNSRHPSDDSSNVRRFQMMIDEAMK
jgi:hypothetical protein